MFNPYHFVRHHAGVFAMKLGMTLMRITNLGRIVLATGTDRFDYWEDLADSLASESFTDEEPP